MSDNNLNRLFNSMERRSKLYWNWYLLNLWAGSFLKLSIAICTALLIGDTGLRSLAIYPDEGLLHILPVITGIIITIDAWWNPMEKRKAFLICGQQIDTLIDASHIDLESCKTSEDRISIVKRTSSEFELIVKKVLGIYDY